MLGLQTNDRWGARGRSFVLLGVVVTALGCADEASPDEARSRKGQGARPTPVLEEIDETVADAPTVELRGAAEGASVDNVDRRLSAGAVEVQTTQGGCSGVMIGSSMVITNAHCFHEGKDSGYMTARIALALEGRRWRCLSGTAEASDGRCSTNATVSYERYEAVDVPATGRDLMVIFPQEPGTPWFGGVAHLAAPSIWTGRLGWDGSFSGGMTLFGRGYDSDGRTGNRIMRYAHFGQPDVDVGAASFRFTVGDHGQPCEGDSGGPYEESTPFSSHPGMLLGLHVTHSNVDACTANGGTAMAVKFTANKMNWINSMRRYNGYGDCYNIFDSQWLWGCD